MHVLAVENVQARQTGARMTADRIKRLSVQELEACGLPELVTLGLQANLAVIGALNEEIAKIEKRLAQCLRPRPEYALLSTAPGIGRILGPTILLETGSIERFARVGNAKTARPPLALLTTAGLWVTPI
jgi:transposase